MIGKVEGAIKTFDLEKGEICGGIEAGTDQDPILAVTTILNREGMAIGQRLKYLFVKLKSFSIIFAFGRAIRYRQFSQKHLEFFFLTNCVV